MAKEILVQRKGRIVHLTFNRPRKGNLMSMRMQEFLADMANELGRDDKTCAIVLRGNGKDFCHGREQKLPGGPPKNAFDMHNRAMGKILAVYTAFRNCPGADHQRGARQGAGLRLRAGRRVGRRLCLDGGTLRAARDGARHRAHPRHGGARQGRAQDGHRHGVFARGDRRGDGAGVGACQPRLPA